MGSRKQGSDGYIGVVLDEHVYRCFSDDDKKKPQQIIDDLQGDVLTNLNDNGKELISLLVNTRVFWISNPGIMIKCR